MLRRSSVNDAYISDVVVLWPPHIVAVACISIAAIYRDVDLRQWQASLNCDTQNVSRVMEELITMYDIVGNKQKFHVQIAQMISILDKFFDDLLK